MGRMKDGKVSDLPIYSALRACRLSILLMVFVIQLPAIAMMIMSERFAEDYHLDKLVIRIA